MSETVPGGIYQDAVGEGFHDAHGNPVDKSKLAEAVKLNREYVAKFTPPAQASSDSVQRLADTLATSLLQRPTSPSDTAPGDLATPAEKQESKAK